MAGAILGAIADDFTGATDLAGMLVKQGLRTVQTIGVPEASGLALWTQEVDAVVVALKTRTAPAQEAQADALAALAWLQAQGCQRFVSKICSTFDSTPAGNIGPIAEALMDALGTELALVCPAFPANARTVYRGHLFVGDALLSDTGMREHPLTPMTDANLVRVLQAQSRRPVALLPWPVVANGAEAVARELTRLHAQGVGLVIADAISDADLLTLGLGCRAWPLVVAGSGMAIGLAAQLRAAGQLAALPISTSISRSISTSSPSLISASPSIPTPPATSQAAPRVAAALPAVRGPALVVAGSCSSATQAQVERMRGCRPAWRIDPAQAVQTPDTAVAEALQWALTRLGDEPILIYSTASAGEVRAAQAVLGSQAAGEAVEDVLARITQALVEHGVRRLIIAGGETSGAVVRRLGVRALRIGPEIAPGVPWTVTLDGNALAGGAGGAEGAGEADGADGASGSGRGAQPMLALALKSGNFGDPDFFLQAWSRLQ